MPERQSRASEGSGRALRADLVGSAAATAAGASIGLIARRAEVLVRAAKSFSDHRCSILAGGVTYFALVSLFPLVLVVLSVAGFIWTDPADQRELIDEILDALPLDEESGRADLERLIDAVVSARGTLGLFGLVAAAYTGSAMFGAVRHALNEVFEVQESRPLVLGKLVDLSLVLVFGALLVLSTAATFAIALVAAFASEFMGEEAARAVRLGSAALYVVLPAGISTLIFLLLYSKVARADVTWRQALAGALVAALAFEVLKVGFAEYVAAFGNYEATYGALGFVIILLLFFYLSSQVMLFGAEVVRADREFRAAPSRRELDSMRAVIDRVRARIPLLRGRASAGPHAPPPTSASAEARAAEVPRPGSGLCRCAGCRLRAGGAGPSSRRRLSRRWSRQPRRECR